MRSIPFAEQETIIRWAADETRATISTSNPAVIRKLDKLVKESPDAYKKLHALTDDHDAQYTMPAKLVRFGKPLSESNKALRQSIASRINSERQNAVNDREKTTTNASSDSFPYPPHDTAETHVHEEENA